ncbi:zinc dependent phospholipase C family protein [Methylophilus medardicus]|uniref:Zinc dependent phospholipase C family protein n=1 Tax=Methylophilus medardicus TaxID=2588534 RepID=A0A5B8CRP3_9PROT|nr:zinc dependent phospholipase C family protein [Methylophilus medardicus]QDC43839.1 zinc dependent phospholipase C family protein [Methylophilus medardicus]QDC48846.1 zinc dependent phospholipase C family protein [Methylophilus medardicus]QDC52551.1 zinc dependent phospholipase C family protein [Methylophilus medardicus]
MSRPSMFALMLLLLALPSHAHAWGLYSHVAYTHQWLQALPLLPLPWLGVMRRYPTLVLAGACLPDLAVVSRTFNHSHGWGIGQQLLHTHNERQLALGIGYNVHLLTDVVAHQHFVPTFEAKWQHHSLLTHAAAEWAMDAYLHTPTLPAPSKLLRIHRKTIVDTLSQALSCDRHTVNKAVSRLANADQALRLSHIPQYLLHRYRKLDNEFEHKLAYYRDQVTLALHDLPTLLNGQFPSLHAEHINLGMEQLDDWRQKCLQDARLRPTRAIRAFEHYHHQWSNQPDC